MDLGLSGRRALVTASSGGIGAAVARRLAGEGCAVLVHGRDEGRASEVAQSVRGECDVVLGDLTDDEAAAEVAARARRWGVDVLVNNAGPFAEHDWETAEPSAWLDAMNGNVVSAVRLIRGLVPRCASAAGDGSSTSAAAPRPRPSRTWSTTPPRRPPSST